MHYSMEHDIHAFEYPLNQNYSQFLFYSSFMIGISSCIAFYMNDTFLTLFLFLLFLTSVNYWRKPDYGLRRQIDMFLCGCCAFYFTTIAFLFLPEFNRVMYLNTSICVGVFYILEYVLYYMKNVKWIIFHMAMHMYISFFSVLILLVFIEHQYKKHGPDKIVGYIDRLFEIIKQATSL